jgi:tRNA threonylcarbamoyladenosine biosynthesis protein TsaE
LGAGKTFITRSIIKNCGWDDLVKSPTYTLCEEYDLDEFLFLHIDLYRTNEAQDIDIFNLDRVLYKKKIVLIEWPERLQLDRKYDLKIDFFHLENKRKINITIGTDVFKTLEAKYE